MHKRRQFSARERVVGGLIGLTGVSVGLFGAGAFSNHSFQFAYLLWNLFLAWLPFFGKRVAHQKSAHSCLERLAAAEPNAAVAFTATQQLLYD